MVGAEEGSVRREGRAAVWRVRIIGARPNANHATGSISTQLCQHPNATNDITIKPGTFVLGYPLFRWRSSEELADIFLIGRAMVWKSRTN
jgi:hypothetical protein